MPSQFYPLTPPVAQSGGCAIDTLFARWFVGRDFALHVVMNTIIIAMSSSFSS